MFLVFLFFFFFIYLKLRIFRSWINLVWIMDDINFTSRRINRERMFSFLSIRSFESFVFMKINLILENFLIECKYVNLDNWVNRGKRGLLWYFSFFFFYLSFWSFRFRKNMKICRICRIISMYKITCNYGEQLNVNMNNYQVNGSSE